MASLPTPGVTTDWGDDVNAAVESLHLTGNHSSRPSTDLVAGTLYSCTDHRLIYRWDGSSWTAYGPRTGTVLLEATGTSADVPALTPVGSIVFRKGAPSTLWDFRTGSLPSGWSRRGVASETFDSNGMTATLGSGQGYQIEQPTPVPSAYTLEASIYSGSFASKMQALMATNSSGGGQGVTAYNGPAGVLGVGVSAWAYASSFTNGGGTPSYPMRLRLRYASGTYFASMSTDGGLIYTAEVSRADATVTSVFSVGELVGSSTLTLAWVRYTPGATATTGPLGWWDGSAIVAF